MNAIEQKLLLAWLQAEIARSQGAAHSYPLNLARLSRVADLLDSYVSQNISTDSIHRRSDLDRPPVDDFSD